MSLEFNNIPETQTIKATGPDNEENNEIRDCLECPYIHTKHEFNSMVYYDTKDISDCHSRLKNYEGSKMQEVFGDIQCGLALLAIESALDFDTPEPAAVGPNYAT